MKRACLTLLLLSLGMTACIVEPGPGYGGRGYYSEGHGGNYGEHGYGGR